MSDHHHHHHHHHDHEDDTHGFFKNPLFNGIIIVIAVCFIVFLMILALDQRAVVRLINFSKPDPNAQVQEYYHLTEVVELREVEAGNMDGQTESEMLEDGIEIKVKFVDDRPEQLLVVTRNDIGFFDKDGESYLQKGDEVIVSEVRVADETIYGVLDIYRFDGAIWALILFLTVAVVFSGVKGFSSFVGLITSLMVLVLFVVPNVIAGGNTILITLGGAAMIAVISLYLAHGFNKRTSIALASTLISIFISVFLAYIFVEIANLVGAGSEDALFLQASENIKVPLKGLLLSGIIIGTLGVLDDITTAQTAMIEEFRNTDPKLTFVQLFKKGTSVGIEHISSLVNTLVLAYAGSSFPLFIILVTNHAKPLWVLLNNENIIEEVVRTLVGSTTLVLAVPISTALAAYMYGRTAKVK